MSDTITPFAVRIDERQIEDLRARLRNTRWPEPENVSDWSQGIPLAYVQELCRYWADDYPMTRVADRLNAHPQFTTTVEGLDVHFLHVRSRHADATPVIMTHGWPGSVVEFLGVIDALTDPEDPADALHLVIPSLPGYGWSGKPPTHGTGVPEIAAIWAQLMARLGYERYGAQGGDWGCMVTTHLGRIDPEHVIGIHLNMALANPGKLLELGEPTAEEQAALANLANYTDMESGYAQQQRTRPQTLGYGLTDSPAGQCAWIVEKFHAWSQCGENPENAFSRDDMLDNVMVYWLTASATSSARLYWHSMHREFAAFEQVPAATAYSCFPGEIARLSERWVRTRYPNLVYYGTPERGGHFAAFEVPELFVREVRAAFRSIRAAGA